MPGFTKTYKENQGFCLKKGNSCIEIKVLEVRGRSRSTRATLQVDGVEGIKGAYLDYLSKKINLTEDITIGLGKEQKNNGKVRINFSAPREYEFQRI